MDVRADTMADKSFDERLAALMRATQEGDAAAYRELLNTVTPRIRRIVARQRGFVGVTEVEDLVQEILLSVHKVRSTYDAARPFMPWLLAIVRNRLADGARRYARTTAREVALEDIDLTFVAHAANPLEESAADAQRLHDAVRSLPPRQRVAIELLKLQGLSLNEAAVLTGMKVGALKVATHRAMASLRRALGLEPGRP